MKSKFCLFLLWILPLTILAQQPRQELRGVWISTVKMLDYPSQRGLNSFQLKQEYIKILDSLQKIHINAIFFQVRPAADAFFPSKYEPWSEWLTGKQGQPPKPYFDPLKFFIEQAHKRGMQFHAWINPFRAIATIEYADVVPWHISKTKPQWFFDYGLHRYFNPGIPEVRDYIVKIIADIVRRYDVDGIHFDDYFYPYPERDQNGKIISIPDRKTYLIYGKNFKNIKEWRRYNITTFIKHEFSKNIIENIFYQNLDYLKRNSYLIDFKPDYNYSPQKVSYNEYKNKNYYELILLVNNCKTFFQFNNSYLKKIIIPTKQAIINIIESNTV
jgi:uncharacterized lipoprotein YddW (UPF0748 family)